MQSLQCVTISNLHAASDLINVDLPDSPSVYDQRCGRIRRLGSTHSVVRIHNYATVGSVFEKKFNRILSKKAIIRQVVENSGHDGAAIEEATKLMDEEILKEVEARKKK